MLPILAAVEGAAPAGDALAPVHLWILGIAMVVAFAVSFVVTPKGDDHH